MKKNIFTIGFAALILTFLCCLISCGKTYKNSNWQLKIRAAKWEKKPIGPGFIETGSVEIEVLYLGSEDPDRMTLPEFVLRDETGAAIGEKIILVYSYYKTWRTRFFILPINGIKPEKVFLHFADFSPIPITLK